MKGDYSSKQRNVINIFNGKAVCLMRYVCVLAVLKQINKSL
jgi:hypothetical protein